MVIRRKEPFDQPPHVHPPFTFLGEAIPASFLRGRQGKLQPAFLSKNWAGPTVNFKYVQHPREKLAEVLSALVSFSRASHDARFNQEPQGSPSEGSIRTWSARTTPSDGYGSKLNH